MSLQTWKITITGCIQGIGFRPFVFRMAHKAKVTGRVANLGDGRVEIVTTGTMNQLKEFENILVKEKPELAVYDTFNKKISLELLEFDDFIISKSKKGSNKPNASYIPPDLSICDECVLEIKNKKLARRYNYAFTSCVNCGPRYTIIHGLPYDRPLTEMKNFDFCDTCLKEYQNPFDRRFHAQTTCCTDCGPQYKIFARDGTQIETEDPFRFLAEKLRNGKIAAIKGIGGTHIACDPFNDEVILRLRKKKGERKEKPFALMALSLDKIKEHAIVSQKDEEVLTSLRRPIVLLSKKEESNLSNFINPKLHNIGFMLPYSGLHYLLLWSGLPILVMTSANVSHQPMLIKNENIKKELLKSQLADYFLLHNREIYQRCDDSVIKSYRDPNLSPLFIRRSRGFTPEPLNLHPSLGENISIGTGAEMHTAAAVAVKGKVFQTQYLGTVSYLENWNFWQKAFSHLKNLLNINEVQNIVCDMHPDYETTQYAIEYGENNNLPVIEAQHHHAHATSLMVDNNLGIEDEILAITLDGVGYGSDKTIWGGEILSANYYDFKREASIKSFPIPGGDIATKYPIRSAIGILYSYGWKKDEIYNFLMEGINKLPHGVKEYEIIWQQLVKGVNAPLTSSTGRLLDAASAILNISQKQTYEGSPAIMMESVGIKNPNNTLKFNSSIINSEINPGILIEQLLSLKQTKKVSVLAASFQKSLALDLVTLSKQKVDNLGIKTVGLTGGVAVNYFLRKEFLKFFNKDLIEHINLSPGDGGISVGQAVIGLARDI